MRDEHVKRTFGLLPAHMARRAPSSEGLIHKDKRYTFGKASEEVDRAAKALIKLGVQRGDHVSLWLNNSANWVFISFALAKIGAVQIPVNTRFRTHDLDYVLRQSDSSMLITHDVSGPIDYLAMVRNVVALPTHGCDIEDPSFPLLRRVVILGDDSALGTVPWELALARGEAISDQELSRRAESVEPESPVLIMYTSGTTGFPKGVVHTHELVRNIEERAFRMAITPNDTILNYLPLFHTFGYSEGVLMSMLTGAKHVLTETFDPDAALGLVQSERVTIVHGFETHFKGLAEAQEASPRDLSTLRTGIFAAGMHSATPIARRALKTLAPLRPVSVYGMTEFWIGAALGGLHDNDLQIAESSGYPGLGYELRILDPDTSKPCPVGVPGELHVKGLSMMQGYYKKPEETAASYTTDNWFNTGDTAYWCEDGYLRFLGRYRDMLKVGGENVDPMEVEGLLLEHPEVHQVAIVGLPDDVLAEVGVAFVQREVGVPLTASDVVQYCRGKVASFKIPRHVIFIDEFPMTASGKIRKVELREIAKKELRPSTGGV